MRLFLGSCVACSASAVLAAPAQAPSAGTVELDPIEVQGQPRPGSAYQAATGPVTGFTATETTAATKTATPIEQTPASVSVVGRPQIVATGAQTVPEALRFTPGVRSDTFGFDPRVDWFLIRGFQANDTGYFLDGLQLYNNEDVASYRLEPWGLERIDILRGPASAVYGGTGPGGIIDAISKRPTSVPLHQVEVGVNNFGNAYGAFDVSGPVAQGSPWSYRVAALGRAGGSQVDFTDVDRGFVAPSLSYRPDGATTLTFLGQYQRDFTQAFNFLPYEGTVVRAPYGRISTSTFTSDPAISRFDREQSFVGWAFEHSFAGDITVRQNLRYAYVYAPYVDPFAQGYLEPPTATSALLARSTFATFNRARELALDNQLETHADTLGVRHDLLFGIDYKHFIIDQNEGQQDDVAPFNLLRPDYGVVTTLPSTRFTLATSTEDQLGFYAQDQAKLGRVDVVAGAREDLVDSHIDDRLDPTMSSEGAPKRFTGRIAALYDTGYGINPYAGYSTFFSPLLGTTGMASQPLRPESGDQEEVGVKYKTPGLPITASLALFNVTRTNVVRPDPNNDQLQVQTGEERSRGIELGANATLMEGLNAVGAFTAYRITNTRDPDATIVGKVPVATPQTLSSLFLDYTIPGGDWRGFGFGAGERFVGSSFATEMNDRKVPDYWLTDAGLHFERDGYRLALNVQNLLDRTFVSSCDSLDGCYYGDRRRITASLSYRW